jgi:hypothetical protein
MSDEEETQRRVAEQLSGLPLDVRVALMSLVDAVIGFADEERAIPRAAGPWSGPLRGSAPEVPCEFGRSTAR